MAASADPLHAPARVHYPFAIKLPAKLHGILSEFAESGVGRQLHDPVAARGRCKDGSLALLSVLHERGVPDATLLNLARESEQHYVVRIGDVILDPTARQFDSDSSVPRIATVTEVAAEWPFWNPVGLDNAWDLRLHNLPRLVGDWQVLSVGLPPRSDDMLQQSIVSTRELP